LVILALGGESDLSVPDGAQAGDLTLEPCSYETESGALDADCGTLVVPENRADPGSRLIALPVTRIRSTSGSSSEPIFRLQGGPGISNMTFSQASRITDGHDVVLVGYRGVEGSSVLECPEVVSALKSSADLAEEESFERSADAFADCARRLTDEGADLDGYSLPQRVDDLEAVRTALGYDRINLVSESVGTRTAMIYSWRYPESLHRSVMVAVNPPGRFLWDPATTDELLARYGELCAADAACSDRTDDLVASMRTTSDDMPDRWWWLPIKDGNVKAGSLFGLFETNDGSAPLHAPATLDSWLVAADGNGGGFWFLSFMADLAFPEAFVWGEYAATGAVDSEAADAYYATGGDPGSILGNKATDFMWAGGRLTSAWLASPDYAEYRTVQPSAVETLLVSGTLDFSTPDRFATEELLPSLANGQQVILDGFGHSEDFWTYQSEASEQLLTTFFDTGQVDDSQYGPQVVDFEVSGPTHATMARFLVGALIAITLLAVALLVWMALRVRASGGFGPNGSAWLRSLAPVLLGLGSWFAALLVVMPLWPAAPLDSTVVVVLSMGLAIGAGLFLAWVDRGRSPNTSYLGLAAAIAGALIGAWLGFKTIPGLLAVATTILGATIIGNLALIVFDIVRPADYPPPQAGPDLTEDSAAAEAEPPLQLGEPQPLQPAQKD
jgi:pimeloyl-ACP methyl ester carboxylesterase